MQNVASKHLVITDFFRFLIEPRSEIFNMFCIYISMFIHGVHTMNDLYSIADRTKICYYKIFG